jgi:hypothetical protein
MAMSRAQFRKTTSTVPGSRTKGKLKPMQPMQPSLTNPTGTPMMRKGGKVK